MTVMSRHVKDLEGPRLSGNAHRPPLRKVVSGICSDKVANPSEESTGADPKAWGYDQPEDASEKLSVIDLS